MLLFRKPTAEKIRAFLTAQAKYDVTYSSPGPASTPLAGFVVDHTRVNLGTGASTFAAARNAVKRWQQFQLGWVEALPTDTPINEGQVIAVLARLLGVWWLNACRIVAVIDENGPVQRFGFAYGTLPGHVESGEERFLIEWDKRDDSVWYDVRAFSRPRHFLARLGYPLARRIQKRFGRESAAAMLRAMNERPIQA